mgnify:CR=1 FL=1
MLTGSSLSSAVRRGLITALLAAGAGSGALAADKAAARLDHALLAQAEGLYSGSSGKIDEAQACPLFERAAEADPVARLRLASLIYQGRCGFEKNPARSAELAPAELVARVAELARAGDALAQVNLGSYYLIGVGGTADPALALPLLRQAAEAKQVWALHNLGWMYSSGTGVPQDPAEARAWYQRAAEAGNAYSMTDLGLSFGFGKGVSLSRRAAIEWFGRAVERGYDRALEPLIALYLPGGKLPPDARQVLPWLERQGLKGGPWVPDQLLRLVNEGVLDAAAQAGVVKAFEDAAAQRNPHAQALLALFELDGWMGAQGTPQHGLALARQAAEGGSPLGMRIYGHLLHNGQGVTRDLGAAAGWFRRGGEGGDPVAMIWLADQLLEGEGVPKDVPAAVAWLERAARVGSPHAMQDLGLLYDEGAEGLPRDPTKAAAWLERAAARGMDLAQGWIKARQAGAILQ